MRRCCGAGDIEGGVGSGQPTWGVLLCGRKLSDLPISKLPRPFREEPFSVRPPVARRLLDLLLLKGSVLTGYGDRPQERSGVHHGLALEDQFQLGVGPEIDAGPGFGEASVKDGPKVLRFPAADRSPSRFAVRGCSISKVLFVRSSRIRPACCWLDPGSWSSGSRLW